MVDQVDELALAFRDCFEVTVAGQRVLEHLVLKFGGAIYVPGGAEGARETDYRAGKRAVLDHILTMCNRANGATIDPNEGDHHV